MKNRGLKALIFLGILLLPFAALRAADGRAGNNVYVAKDDIISGNFYAAGETITIDGTVSGDLIVAGQTISVNGLVEGDVIAAGQNITVNGPVGGNIRVAGNSLTINGSVARNVTAFGANVILGPESSVGWDVFGAGANLEARGSIGGSLNVHAGQAIIAGQVGRDANVDLGKSRDGRLTIAPTAVINGNLSYVSRVAAEISERAGIAGQTEQKIPASRENNRMTGWLWSRLFGMLSALIVGFALVLGLKDLTLKILEKLEKEPARAILPGLIIMLILPPIALILFVTLIGIPLALITVAFWLILSYLAKIVTALWLGRLIAKELIKQELSLAWSLVIGVIVLWLLFAIPFIGWLICLIAAWFGIGAIWNYVSKS